MTITNRKSSFSDDGEPSPMERPRSTSNSATSAWSDSASDSATEAEVAILRGQLAGVTAQLAEQRWREQALRDELAALTSPKPPRPEKKVRIDGGPLASTDSFSTRYPPPPAIYTVGCTRCSVECRRADRGHSIPPRNVTRQCLTSLPNEGSTEDIVV
jgi:hypothetical protein